MRDFTRLKTTKSFNNRIIHQIPTILGKMLSELLVSLEIALFCNNFAALTAIFIIFSSVNLFGKYNAVVCNWL